MKIRDRELSIPIIQGGMGVGISLSGLAGAVAACGGMGVISAAHPGYRDPDFYRDPLNVNRRCLKEEIAKAKEIAKGCGLVGVNVMVAVQHYADYVRAAIEGGADAIISGAGLPTELPQIAGDSKVLLAPIVSSGTGCPGDLPGLGAAWKPPARLCGSGGQPCRRTPGLLC